MATAPRPPPVNRGYYAESSQARPLTTGDLGHPLHISTFRTYGFALVLRPKHGRAEHTLGRDREVPV
jgi:hypothetical protein